MVGGGWEDSKEEGRRDGWMEEWCQGRYVKSSKGEPVQFVGGFFDGREEKALEGLAAARVDPSAFGVVRRVGMVMMMTRQ